MPRRNAPDRVEGLEDLSHLEEWVYDKRLEQRASVKKNRRNRHYEKLFMRHVVARHAIQGAARGRTDEETAHDSKVSSETRVEGAPPTCEGAEPINAQ
jgi:hypothetical protein